MMKKGKVLYTNSPQTLLKKIEDKVWIVTTSPSELTFYQQRYKIGNVVQRNDRLELRILSNRKPSETACPESPNLEDLYLYYFSDEGI